MECAKIVNMTYAKITQNFDLLNRLCSPQNCVSPVALANLKSKIEWLP